MDRNKGLKKINHKFEMPPTFGDAVSLVDKVVPLEAETIINTGLQDKWPSDKGYGKLVEKISECDEAIKRDIQRGGYVQEKYEDTTLDTLIRQDVEHGTFRAQNCFDDEYLTPMFYKYAKGLEKEVEFLRAELNAVKEELDKQIAANEAQESVNGQSKS